MLNKCVIYAKLITNMLIYFLIIGLCIALQAERGIFDFLSYLRLFKQLKNTKNGKNTNEKKPLYILIPVLREQPIIEETILRFCKIKNQHFDLRIAILTSIREVTDEPPTTEDVVVKSMEFGKLAPYRYSISIFRDTTVRGNMATQLNYAVDKIKSSDGPETLYLVYNADSVISETTLEKLWALLQTYSDKKFALQQPCAFVRDMQPNSNQFTNAMSLYQSWYCLGHESRIIRNYDKKFRHNRVEINNNKLGVVVGHGSGMTININTSNGGYPTDLLTEDLTFGFILSTKNVPILSLQALEIADVPNCFTIFIKQKSVWFWNFLGYASCYKKMRKQGHKMTQMVPLLVSGLAAGAYWFLDTFFIVAPLVLGVILKSYHIILISILSFISFYIIPQYFLKRNLPDVLEKQGFPEYAKNVRSVSFIKLLPSLCLIILTNSVGPWIATLGYINYIFEGGLPTKYKTGD